MKTILSIVFFAWMPVCVCSQNSESVAVSSKKYSDIIPISAKKQVGLLSIDFVDNNFYFEIPDSLLGKDFLLITRLVQGSLGRPSNGLSGPILPGDEVSEIVIRLERVGGNRIFIRKILNSTYADSSSSLIKAVNRLDESPIIGSLAIECNNPITKAYVVNVTDYLNGNSEMVSFNESLKSIFSLSSYVKENSIVQTINSFPSNVEISTIKTFKRSGIPADAAASSLSDFSFSLNTSIILLPAIPMEKRMADLRVGYFSLSQDLFKESETGVSQVNYIKRWRLEPKPEDMQKYKRGELVEPVKPIVFYIDPATPRKWVPYLIQGINDWQAAFEQAGFKNAIIGKMAPTMQEDSCWSLYDARHSAIVYKASEIENASGPTIVDPRTGEILESHINWHHNVMQLIHDWYMIQCGAVDPGARKQVFDDSLMGKLIRFVCSHEVGHSLGLTHNFSASSTVPSDSLRSKKWVAQFGLCPSIMDYARFNYVAQPQDGIPQDGLLPKIGAYDKWAIEWGYRYFTQFDSVEIQQKYLHKWTEDKIKDKSLLYIQEQNWGDPRKQTEDLGDDLIKSNEYGIANLKRVIPQLSKWVSTSTEAGAALADIYQKACSRLEQYLLAPREYIGGLYESLSNWEQGSVYSPVTKEQSIQTFAFYKKNLLANPPLWLIDSAILNKTGLDGCNILNNIYENFFTNLFFVPNLSITLRNEAIYRDRVYTVRELFDDLTQTVWTELFSHKPVTLWRRNEQSVYVRTLLEQFSRTKARASLMFPFPLIKDHISHYNIYDAASIVYNHLLSLEKRMEKALPSINDKLTKEHFTYLAYKIKMNLNDPNNKFGY